MNNSVAFEDFRKEWLADVRAGTPSTTELGHRFARKLITQWLDIDDASDDLVYCDGAGDGGIDIAYFHRGESGENANEDLTEGHTWYLVQSKYGSAFQGSGTLLGEARKVIDTVDGQRQRLSSLAEGLFERLSTFRRQASERDRLILVFATEAPLNEEQKRTLDDVRAMGRSRLGAIFDVESVSIETIYLRTLEDIAGTSQVRVPINAALARSGEELLVGSVPLLSLYEFLRAYRTQTDDLDQLYEKNVRRFLGNRGKVNKAMLQTLRQAPEHFGLYNNGITIVVADFQGVDGGIVELTDPYVVNGCQTTRTIWEVCHSRLEAGGTGVDPEIEEWREKMRQGVVVAKIVKVGVENETMLQAITRYTNSQNAVREKDFLTLTSDFKTWAKQMGDRYAVYLEIQRGGWDSRRALQRQNPKVMQFEKAANAFDLLKVYGAGWLGEAGPAFGRNAAFLPNGTVFKRIMNNQDGGEPFGVEDLYAAYCLQRAADKYGFGRGASSPSRRQTRFLFYMVVLELLQDVIIRSQPNTTEVTPRELTNALIKLFEAGQEVAAEALLDTAIDVIDEYLTHGTEDSVFKERSFRNTFNNDLNAYLKWEQLGKTEEASPFFRSLLTITKKTMSRSTGGQLSPRELIASVVNN